MLVLPAIAVGQVQTRLGIVQQLLIYKNIIEENDVRAFPLSSYSTAHFPCRRFRRPTGLKSTEHSRCYGKTQQVRVIIGQEEKKGPA